MNLAGLSKVIVFGGTFDPPHWGHVRLPEQVRQRCEADAVVYVPAGRSPHKLDREQSDAADRLAMLELALQGAAHAMIFREEIDRGEGDEPSYTVDTLEQLAKRLDANATMRLLIGTDQALAFERWRNPARVAELAEPVVMLRPPQTRKAFLSQFDHAGTRSLWARRLVDVDRLDVSSTQVRAHVRAGKPIDELVPPPVGRYIEQHGLYTQCM